MFDVEWIGVVSLLAASGRADITAADEAKAGKVEEYGFQAETKRLMDIIVHSLYSNREIFIRELVSNAADASDKLRMIALTDATIDTSRMAIRVDFSEENGTITIADRGVGMSREELMNNLGTIAKSGTSSFLEQYEKTKDEATLIGQFGVGFYSAFLVADTVTVSSRPIRGDAHVWQSDGTGAFTIRADTEGVQPERGTKVTLKVREDAKEFVNHQRLKELLVKYSSYIDFSIWLAEYRTWGASGELERDGDEVIDDEPKAADDGAAKPADGGEKDAATKVDEGAAEEEKLEDGADAADSASEPEKRQVWHYVNKVKPLWRRAPENVTDAEYVQFYQSISRYPGVPIASTHFNAEGEISFKALLYVPEKPPYEMPADHDAQKLQNIRLYVRRVLVKEHFEGGLLPRFLSFLLGIVDSDDLPINVSREMLQQSRAMELIRKKLVRKALEMLRNLARDADKEIEEQHKEEQENGATSAKRKETSYSKFWKKNGVSMKLGVMEDRLNQKRLVQLLRFKSSRTDLADENDLVSMDDYVSRMKAGQEHIYYHTGSSLEAVATSPFLERLQERGYEVLYMTDPIDEYWTQHYQEHDGIVLMPVSKENFSFSKDDEREAKQRLEAARQRIKPLTAALKTQLGDRVERVKLSNRLKSVPLMISSDQMGYSANMELILRAQSYNDPLELEYIRSRGAKKVIEINPFHPLVERLAEMVQADPGNDSVLVLMETMYDTALVSSGFHVYNTEEYSERMSRLLAESLEIDFDDMKRELAATSAEDAEKARENIRREREEQLRKEEEENRRQREEEAAAKARGENADAAAGNDGADDVIDLDAGAAEAAHSAHSAHSADKEEL